MLVKRSGKNQIAIPKRLITEAGLDTEDVYFDIQYSSGCFVLKPLQLEEKIPREALERFKAKTLKKETGDQSYPSLDHAITGLDHGKKKH